MPAPAQYAAFIAAGATGASHPLTSASGGGFVGGQPLWNSVFIKADRDSGTDLLTLRSEVLWFDADGVATSPASTWVDRTIDATQPWTFYEDKHEAPADAVAAKQKFTLTPAASPMQHDVWVSKPRLGLTQVAADITSYIDGPNGASFAHSYDGVAESGQFPRDINFKLMASGVFVSSGVTWTYIVKSGTVNGFTSASGAQSMSGSGLGTITISSMATNAAELEIRASLAGSIRTKQISLAKTFADAPTGGGGPATLVSKTSGFNAINSTTFTDITGTMSGTIPTGETAANIAINLTTVHSSPGTQDVHVKIQRFIGGVWTDKGVEQIKETSSEFTPEDGFTYQEASFIYDFDDTGLTAGLSYDWRIVAKLSTGAIPHNWTGSVIITS